MCSFLLLVKSYEGMEMWVDTFLPLSRGFVFNGVNGVLRIKNTGRRTRERISKGCVCVCVWSLMRLLITGHCHWRAVIWKRWPFFGIAINIYYPLPFSPPSLLLFENCFQNSFFRLSVVIIVIYEYSIIRWRDLFSNSASRDRWARENKVLL